MQMLVHTVLKRWHEHFALEPEPGNAPWPTHYARTLTRRDIVRVGGDGDDGSSSRAGASTSVSWNAADGGGAKDGGSGDGSVRAEDGGHASESADSVVGICISQLNFDKYYVGTIHLGTRLSSATARAAIAHSLQQAISRARLCLNFGGNVDCLYEAAEHFSGPGGRNAGTGLCEACQLRIRTNATQLRPRQPEEASFLICKRAIEKLIVTWTTDMQSAEEREALSHPLLLKRQGDAAAAASAAAAAALRAAAHGAARARAAAKAVDAGEQGAGGTTQEQHQAAMEGDVAHGGHGMDAMQIGEDDAVSLVVDRRRLSSAAEARASAARLERAYELPTHVRNAGAAHAVAAAAALAAQQQHQQHQQHDHRQQYQLQREEDLSSAQLDVNRKHHEMLHRAANGEASLVNCPGSCTRPAALRAYLWKQEWSWLLPDVETARVALEHVVRAHGRLRVVYLLV